MDEAVAQRGLEAAERLAAVSPHVQARMGDWSSDGLPSGLRVASAFREIGRAIASKRNPLSERDLKRVFGEVEKLLRSSDGDVANAVATNLLEEIWRGAHQSGFDFSTVAPHLGPEARRYLLSWDEFNRTNTPGLKRQ